MERQFICTTTEPVIETKAGKLRGYKIDGTYTFQGIKYCNAKRFQMPTEVEKWEGVKDTMSYGYVCPMLANPVPTAEHLTTHRYWPMDENCQYLNIWTQSIDREAKKPVMVWLHGGGFSDGSSIEQLVYDGTNLSSNGDVVVVSLNHRLNILGYLDLSTFGEKYKNSGNAGNADIVAALKWIRDNIAGFGGDPENVTIFGQSGGGFKVWTLMQTPEADGLFHKGIIQSGLLDGFLSSDKADGTEIVNALCAELNFDSVEQLETVPYTTLADAYNKVSQVLAVQGKYVGCGPIPNEFYAGDPRVVGFTEHAKNIPVMIGTVFGEFLAFAHKVEHRKELTEAQRMDILKVKFKDDTEQLAASFRKAYPNKNITDLLAVDTVFRKPTMDFIEKKAQCQESVTYAYMFDFEFPIDDGKPSWHCSELPYVFHNTKLIPISNRGAASEKLEKQMSDAWISFAKEGKPSSDLLPTWEPCKPGDEPTMIFSDTCEVKHNYDHELIRTYDEIMPILKWQELVIQH